MGPDILAQTLHNYCISRKDNIRPNAYEISFERKKEGKPEQQETRLECRY